MSAGPPRPTGLCLQSQAFDAAVCVGVLGRDAGAGLMNTVISYASGKPSDPLRGYSYVYESNPLPAFDCITNTAPQRCNH